MDTLDAITNPPADDGLTCFLRASRAILEGRLPLLGDLPRSPKRRKPWKHRPPDSAAVVFDRSQPGMVFLLCMVGGEFTVEGAYEPECFVMGDLDSAPRLVGEAAVIAALNESTSALMGEFPGLSDRWLLLDRARLAAPFLRAIVTRAGIGWQERFSASVTH